MIKTLLKSVREYKTASIQTPIFVAVEVILECFIPLVMADLMSGMSDQCRNWRGCTLCSESNYRKRI